MNMKSALVLLACVGGVLAGWAYLVMRKHGVRVELTRNSTANRKAEALEAQKTLQRLAADPKLTVVWQRAKSLEGKRDPVVLCALKRPVLWMLVRPSGSSEAADRLLLQRLDSVDVEPVSYGKEEIPGLITEIAAVRRGNPSSPFSEDLLELWAALKREVPPGTEVAFY